MRQKTLDAAERMVCERGLNAMSFQDLADAIGLRKPSVFHHFRNKEALALALLERCRQNYSDQFDEVIGSEASAPEKLRAIGVIFGRSLRDDQVCLLASLANCISTLPTSVQEDLRKTIDDAAGSLSRLFEQGQREGSLTLEGSPDNAAMAFLAMLQGLQVLARAKREEAVFSKALDTYIAAVAV